MFDLLLLANLNLLAEMPISTLASLLQCPCVPTSFLQWALNHKGDEPDILLAVVMNPNTPRSILEQLIQPGYSPVSKYDC